MSLLLTVLLAVLIAYLWSEMRELRRRVELLEMAPSWTAEPVGIAEAAPIPDIQEDLVSEPMAEMPRAADPAPEPFVVEPWTYTEETAVAETRSGLGFEDIFGRRLPIWVGGITLAVAGFLIVKYSIQAGLLLPATRVILGLIFGTALVAGAEIALRAQAAVRDVRVPQALSGAGLATWFAAVLIAADLYHLIAPTTAFAGLAGVTAIAALLSLRFGAPSAVLGLVGGLAAPALVGSAAPNIPLLSLYLALTVGGLSTVARQRGWWWLGAAALVGGFGWGLLLILGGLIDLSQTLSVGLLTLALAAGLPLLLTGERAPVVRLIAGLAGCAQMAALVALGHYTLPDWGLLGLLSIAALWLSRREAILAEVPALALGVAALLAATWPGPSAGALALVLAGIALIHALPALLRVWTPAARAIDAPVVAGVALTIAILPALHFPQIAPLLRAWPALAGAALVGCVAVWGWRDRARCTGHRFATLAAATAASLGFADAFGLADWTLPGAVALLAFGLQLLGRASANRPVERAGWTFGGVALILLFSDIDQDMRWAGLIDAGDWTALVRWAIPAAAAIGIACAAPRRVAQAAQALAALLFYGACAQAVPDGWLPAVASLLLAAVAAPGRAALRPAAAAVGAVMLCWAADPLIEWLLAGGYATLLTEPFYMPAQDLWPTVRQLALPALALGLSALRLPMALRVRDVVGVVATLLGLVAAHIAYRHVLVIDSPSDFVVRGMMERTIWEMALAALATAVWALRGPHIALALGGAALAHFAWFTMLIHNPLWTYQDVGVWLVPAYATAFFLTLASAWLLPDMERPRSWVMMVLISMFAFSVLRQIAHDPMPLRLGVDGREDIARSVLAIGLAVGFLRFGIARAARDWRMASLGLMLLAAGKVFLFDARGLDGLLRIGAFAALGVSLIGIGWLYSRYLPDESC